MNILVVGLDHRVLDVTTETSRRQRLYYIDHKVNYIVLYDPVRPKWLVLLSALVRASRTLPAGRQVSHLATSEKYDLVTAQDPFFCGWIARIAAKRSNAKLHIQDHSGAFARKPHGWKEWLMYHSARKTVRRADRVRTVSQRGKRGLIAVGVPEERIDVIPIATDVSRFVGVDRSRALPNEILCVSRLEKEKGIDVLLYAFVELRKKIPQAALVIVGDGSLRKGLSHLARRLGVGDSVLFAGQQDDVRPFMARAGVYVQPSRFEGWGMAVIEAAAAGMPIVMTDVGCAGEVIKDGESGLVVPPGDAKALAVALERVMSDVALAQSLGEAAKRAASSLPGPEVTTESIRASFEAAHLSR